MTSEDPFVDIRSEFEARRVRNPAYSLRAFARDMEIGVTSLSDFFAGKRVLSKTNLRKIAGKLNFSPTQEVALVQRGKLIRKNREQHPETEDKRHLLQEDMFRMIADWQNFAILNLARVPGTLADTAWLAERLGIAEELVQETLERLIRLKLVKVHRGGLKRIVEDFDSTKDVPSVALKRLHTSLLQMAQSSLMNDPIEKRYFSASIVPISHDNYLKAKELLRDTHKKLLKLAGRGTPEQVYSVSVQLFPLTRDPQIRDSGPAKGTAAAADEGASDEVI